MYFVVKIEYKHVDFKRFPHEHRTTSTARHARMSVSKITDAYIIIIYNNYNYI